MVNKISLRHNLGFMIFRIRLITSLSYDYEPYSIHIKKGIENQTFGSNNLFLFLQITAVLHPKSLLFWSSNRKI